MTTSAYLRSTVAVFDKEDFDLDQDDLDALERPGQKDRLEEALREVIGRDILEQAVELWRERRTR